MGAAAAISGLAVGIGALSSLSSAQATANADTYKSEQLQLAAQEGELKATQTSGQLTQRLNQTLGNIDAVRAAARGDPSSPTGAEVRNTIESEGENQKNIEVGSILSQSAMDENNAAYLRSASSDALLNGALGAGAGILKGIAGLPSLSGGAPSGSNFFGPGGGMSGY